MTTKKPRRQRRTMASVLADPRWKMLASGRATPEEVADLHAFAEQNEQAAEAWEACRPTTKQESEHLAETLLHCLQASTSTSAPSANPQAGLPRDTDPEDNSQSHTADSAKASNTVLGAIPEESERAITESILQIKRELSFDSTNTGYLICHHVTCKILEVNSRALKFIAEYCNAMNSSQADYHTLEQFTAHALQRRAVGQRWTIMHKSEPRVLRVSARSLAQIKPHWSPEFSLISMYEYNVSRETIADFSELNPAQIELIKLIEDGLSYQEIAARLHSSVPTVRKSIALIYARLGVPSLVEAITTRSMATPSVESPDDVPIDEQQRILDALELSAGDPVKAARALNMGFRTLVGQLDKIRRRFDG